MSSTAKDPITGLTQQMEVFCQAMTNPQTSQADAYRQAYPNSVSWKDATLWSKASTLMANERVRERIDALRKPIIERIQLNHRYDMEQAMVEAEEAFNVAKAKGNGGAMVAAVTLRAKLNGLLIERREVTLNRFEEMTPEQLDRFIIRKQQELEASGKLH